MTTNSATLNGMAVTALGSKAVERAAANQVMQHSRIPELDGVRAIAIWMVLMCHVFYDWSTANFASAHVPGFVAQVIRHGWLGVDLFFILSGFLITGILLDSREKPRYFRTFYARRFLRIMPLYFAVVFLFFLGYRHYRNYFVLSTLFAANLANMFHIRVPHGPGVLWSLAVEEHFYLLWPLLVYFLPRRKLTLLAVSILLLTPVARGIATAHGMPVDMAIYCYSWFRFDGLALGGLLALWVRSSYFTPANSYRLAGLLVGLAVLISVAGAPFGVMHESPLGVAFRFTQAQYPFAALFLLALVHQGTLLTAPLRWSFARLSGNLSYCLYLIHLAIADGYEALLHYFQFQSKTSFDPLATVLLRGLFVIVASFSLALVSKKYFEDPILRLKRYF